MDCGSNLHPGVAVVYGAVNDQLVTKDIGYRPHLSRSNALASFCFTIARTAGGDGSIAQA